MGMGNASSVLTMNQHLYLLRGVYRRNKAHFGIGERLRRI